MKLLVLGGFLGSGKTSVLLQLAKSIVGENVADDKVKLVIIENEIGQVGIDNQILKSDKYQMENLFSGCACCSLAGEIIYTVKDIVNDINPEWIIVESSGVGYPALIRDNIKDKLGYEGTVCTIVDAYRWLDLFDCMDMLLTDQINGTDIVLVNKTDLVDEDMLKQVDDSVKSLVPQAKLFNISAINPLPEEIAIELGY